MLVSTEYLAARLGDPNVVVLHVARERSDYDRGHIPGACLIPWDRLTATREGVAVELPPAEDLQALFESCGAGDKSRIVLYGDAPGLSATRAWFTLDYLGHAGHAALLDGGMEKWRAENRPVSTDIPAPRRSQLRLRLRPQVVVDLSEMRELSRKAASTPGSGVLIIDSRPPADYGDVARETGSVGPGHIPGAINAFWLEDLVSKDNPVLRPAADLDRRYRALGVRPNAPTIVYCRTGVQATRTYFVLRYLGYPVRLYDGSFSEWTSTGKPVTTPQGNH